MTPYQVKHKLHVSLLNLHSEFETLFFLQSIHLYNQGIFATEMGFEANMISDKYHLPTLFINKVILDNNISNILISLSEF